MITRPMPNRSHGSLDRQRNDRVGRHGRPERSCIRFNTGGRYDPSSDSWTPTSTTNAPDPRNAHTAVWTGSEMIVWGGFACVHLFNTGGRYNPSTNSWTATNTTNAPTARDSSHGSVDWQ